MIFSVVDGYVSETFGDWINDLKFCFFRWYGMRLGRVTLIETICCFNWSKSALTFITERLRKPESTKLTWISCWMMLNLKSTILLLLLGIACRSHGYVPLTSCFVLLLLLLPCLFKYHFALDFYNNIWWILDLVPGIVRVRLWSLKLTIFQFCPLNWIYLIILVILCQVQGPNCLKFKIS